MANFIPQKMVLEQTVRAVGVLGIIPSLLVLECGVLAFKSSMVLGLLRKRRWMGVWFSETRSYLAGWSGLVILLLAPKCLGLQGCSTVPSRLGISGLPTLLLSADIDD